MEVKVVIGANYGDEGKGLVSGCLAREAHRKHKKVLTVFYNGTSQRAHTFENVVYRCLAAGRKYRSDTFYHRKFVIDPISLMIEQAGPIIDPDCRVILPCDVLINRKKEQDRGKDRHGSCGFGLFECVKRSLDARYCIRAKDLQDPYSLYRKLKEIEQAYPHPEDDLYNPDMFMRAASFIAGVCEFKTLKEAVKDYDTIIFEGGQGLLLDQRNYDDFPHLTPSSPGSFFIHNDIEEMGVVPELYYVTRSYMTRHGAGPMPLECKKEDINKDIVDTTNGENKFQGKLRFGRINLIDLMERIENDASFYPEAMKNIVVTHLNYTDGKIESSFGRTDPEGWLWMVADNIYLSDQKDQMEVVANGIHIQHSDESV